MEEVDKLSFLFAIEAGAHDDVLAGVGVLWFQLDLPSFLLGLEQGLASRLLSQSRYGQYLVGQHDDPMELVPLLFYDH